jgi:1-acyl-sn-glycerol-3-phosphate acyltransferase
VTSRPTVLHRDRARLAGAYILAANHFSPYDVPCLMYASPRPLDFMSVTEVFRKPLVGPFFGAMNAFPLDRQRPDVPTVRTLLNRLGRGRAVAMFPEGGIRTAETSMLTGAPFKPGIAGLAQLAKVPVIPCAVLGAKAFARSNWLPLRQVRWGANFGEPLTVRTDLPEEAARQAFLEELRAAYRSLYVELCEAMETPPQRSPAGADERQDAMTPR